MTLKNRATLKAEAVTIRDETTQNANTATRVGGTTYDIADSIVTRPLSLGTLSPAAMVFEENGFYSDYTQTGNITLTISGSVVDGIGQAVKFTSDGASTITLDANFDTDAIYGITSGSTLAAGTYWFYMFSINGKIHINVKQAG